MTEFNAVYFAQVAARTCAICGSSRGPIWALSYALKQLGYDEKVNGYAHLDCISSKREALKRGEDK